MRRRCDRLLEVRLAARCGWWRATSEFYDGDFCFEASEFFFQLCFLIAVTLFSTCRFCCRHLSVLHPVHHLFDKKLEPNFFYFLHSNLQVVVTMIFVCFWLSCCTTYECYRLTVNESFVCLESVYFFNDKNVKECVELCLCV
ncbi:hypothetical protein RYX36_008093 [Vicia faba]